MESSLIFLSHTRSSQVLILSPYADAIQECTAVVNCIMAYACERMPICIGRFKLTIRCDTREAW